MLLSTNVIDCGDRIERGEDYRAIQLSNGRGVYQIDFRNYSLEGSRIVFLNPGQYFRVLTGSFQIEQVVLEQGVLSSDPASDESLRLLFLHLYEAGSIESDTCVEKGTPMSATRSWLDHASAVWKRQRPIHPKITDSQLRLLFDVRHLIEQHFAEHRSVEDYAAWVNVSSRRINTVAASRIGRGFTSLIDQRRILEAKRLLTFTSSSVKEISYELGFKDAAYFGRYFRRHQGVTPNQFRRMFEYDASDPFADELMRLIDNNFRTRRDVAFYASQLNISTGWLRRKANRVFAEPISSLIRDRIVSEAKQILTESSKTVASIAQELGFDDPFSFSRFFSHIVGLSPAAYREQSS